MSAQELPQSVKDKMNEAIVMANEGDYQKAVIILSGFENEYPDYLPLKMVIGKIYFEHEQYELSTDYFAKVVESNPNIELVSLAYYHSMMEVENRGGALKELDRFLSLDGADVSLYLPTLEELFDELPTSNMSSNQKEMVTRHYRKYLT